jgi:hypothetical protein
MRSTKRFSMVAVATAFVLAAGGAVAVLPAAADTPTEFIDAGQLTLTTGAVDAVSYEGTTQALAPSGTTCNLDGAGAGSLLTFIGYLGTPGAAGTTSPPVGFKNDSIGVNEEIDSLCYRVDTTSRTGKTEFLDVKLADLKNFAGRPLLAKSAALDIEVKQAGLFNTTKAKIEATALLGNSVQGTFNLIQGSGTSTATTFYCPVGDTKNCQWKIELPADTYFDTLRLKAVAGGFSLKGGSDGPTDSNAKPTTFDLVSEVDQLITCDAEGNPVDPTIADPNASVTYLGDTTGGCTGFGVTLESDPTSLRFLKPSTTVNAQFVVTAIWQPERPSPLTPAITLPAPKVDFELGGGEKDMQFCPDYLFDSEGVLVGITDTSSAEDKANLALLDMDPAAGTQYACVGGRTADVSEANYEVDDTIYLVGDVKMRLP